MFGLVFCSNPACREPEFLPPRSTEEVLNLTKESTFSGLPYWISGQSDILQIPSSYIEITERSHMGQRHCPHSQTASSRRRHGVFQHDLALCPFRFVRNKDRNRIPSTLLQTKCVCPYTSDNRYLCQEVVRYVSVYRRTGCVDGVYVYREVWEQVNVACIAVIIPPGSQAHSRTFRTAP